MTKIKIAIMADKFDFRPERTLYFRKVIEGLLANPKFDVTLIHYKPMSDEGIYKRVNEILLTPLKVPYGGQFFAYLKYCFTTKDRYDIVYTFVPRLFPFFWKFPAKYKVVLAHGGGDIMAKSHWSLDRFVFNWTILLFKKHIDIMIGVSDYANKEIIYAYGVPPEKVVTMYPQLDEIYKKVPEETYTNQVLKKYELENGKYIYYVGRFRIHKNVGNLVNAYLLFREQNPDLSYKLILGGDTKEVYEKTFGSIPEHKYTNDIHFLKYIETEDMPGLYKGARVLTFVTLNEGFGLPIIEAMACKTPVITSNATAMPETAGNCAILVDPNSPEDLAYALKIATSDEVVRNQLIERGLVRSHEFTLERVLNSTFELFEGLVNKKSKMYNPIDKNN